MLMESLYKLPNGDYITPEDVREIFIDTGFDLKDIKTPDRLIIRTTNGEIRIDVSSVLEAQTWRDELAKTVDLSRTKARLDQIANY